MEAEDTVMSDSDMEAMHRFGDFKLGLQAQAEITWKAREPEIEQARQSGMRKVVEWIETTYIAPLTQNAGLVQIRNLEADLKFKLKEWHLE